MPESDAEQRAEARDFADIRRAIPIGGGNTVRQRKNAIQALNRIEHRLLAAEAEVAESRRKVDVYDRARSRVKIEGATRAEWVLHAERAETRADAAVAERQKWEQHAKRLEEALREGGCQFYLGGDIGACQQYEEERPCTACAVLGESVKSYRAPRFATLEFTNGPDWRAGDVVRYTLDGKSIDFKIVSASLRGVRSWFNLLEVESSTATERDETEKT